MARMTDTMNSTRPTPAWPATPSAKAGTQVCSSSKATPIKIVAMMPMPEMGLADEPTKPAM